MSLRASKKVAIISALMALFLGFAHFYSILDAPQSLVPVLDEAAYNAQAVGILNGTWPGGEVFYQDPLYPYMLAFIYKIAGHHIKVVKMVQVIFGAVAVLLVFGIGRRAFSPGIGAFAAVIMTLYRPLYFFEGVLTKELLGLVLICASLYTLLAASDEEKVWMWLLSGFLLGLACLTRGNMLLMIPAWGLWIAVSLSRIYGLKRGLSKAVMFATGAFIAISPVTMHNVLAGDFVLVTSQGGQNFYIGNHLDNMTGTYQSPSFVRPHPLFEEYDFRHEVEKKTGVNMKPSELSTYWYKTTWLHIKASPKDFLWRLWRKTQLLVNNYEISDNINFYFFKKRYSAVLKLPTPGWGFMATMAIFGSLVLLFRLKSDGTQVNKNTSPLLILAVLYSATLVAFYIFARYRLPLLAVAPPLAAFGMTTLIDYVSKPRRRYFIFGSIAVGLLLWQTHKTIIEPRFDVAYYQTGNCLLKLGRWAEAEKEFREALILNPGSAAFRLNLGATLQHLGRYNEALEEYKFALEIAPKYAKAHIGIADTYSALGMYTEAINHYQKGILHGEESSTTWMRLGKLYLKLDKRLHAKMCFGKAVVFDPKNTEAKKLFDGIDAPQEVWGE